MTTKNPEYIVAEVSKSWTGMEPPSHRISLVFEDAIAANRSRGYDLHSWRFCASVTNRCLTETIIAVFRRDQTAKEMP